MRARIVRSIGLVATGVLALSLSACTVPDYGQMAIGVGPNRELVAYLVMCSHHIDHVTLYFDHTHDAALIGEWVASPAATGVSAFPLKTGGNGWRATRKLSALLPREVYRLDGWADDSSGNAPGPTFTATQLGTLKAWQVWARGSDGNEKAMSLNSFVTHVCDNIPTSP
jgi:hypothetical protein